MVIYAVLYSCNKLVIGKLFGGRQQWYMNGKNTEMVRIASWPRGRAPRGEKLIIIEKKYRFRNVLLKNN